MAAREVKETGASSVVVGRYEAHLLPLGILVAHATCATPGCQRYLVKQGKALGVLNPLYFLPYCLSKVLCLFC